MEHSSLDEFLFKMKLYITVLEIFHWSSIEHYFTKLFLSSQSRPISSYPVEHTHSYDPFIRDNRTRPYDDFDVRWIFPSFSIRAWFFLGALVVTSLAFIDVYTVFVPIRFNELSCSTSSWIKWSITDRSGFIPRCTTTCKRTRCVETFWNWWWTWIGLTLIYVKTFASNLSILASFELVMDQFGVAFENSLLNLNPGSQLQL